MDATCVSSYSEYIQQRVVVEGQGAWEVRDDSLEKETSRLKIPFSEGVTPGQIQGKGVPEGFYEMRCDPEALPSYLVYVGFGLVCLLVEYTLLKDVLNRGVPPKK